MISEYENMEISSVNDLPSASKNRYNKAYEEFQKWIKSKGKPITEDILMDYFSELAAKNKPTTLWAYHSMLKATLKLNDQIDISLFAQLSNYLKVKNIGYQPAKAKMFSLEEVTKFINEAPDEKWLDLKVVCVFGVCGAYSTSKLTNVMVEHIKQYDDLYLVTIPKTENNPQRTFTITGDYFHIVQKYMALRPSHANHGRLFIRYQNGRCTIQTIGKHTFQDMPRRIAGFLNLPKHERYTALSFSQTAGNIMSNNTSGPTANDTRWSNVNVTTENYCVPVTYNAIQINNTTDHVCNLSCGQVKCASEENVNDVFHAFNIFKSTDYTIADVTPALFASKPTCRWIVAYNHKSEPIHYSNTDEKFEDITRSTPNNVKVIENFVRMNSIQSFAAYIVIYGVNCRCQKQHVNVPLVKQEDRTDGFESSMDAIKCEPEDPLDFFET